jgi:plastocyanin
MITLFGGLAGAAGTTVKLGDNFFDPDRKTIAKGTRVRFKWIGEEEHNVVKKRGPGPGFASETTDVPGVNFTKRFKRAGRYRLVCTIHPEDMKMTLRVRR